ncbi:MAG: NAD-dependent epimerase/dehydratase family protein [Candidatus Andersenbacteria bacterium]|nr:NAD-dependent epimerase/dehydratase family protein [bacterium]MDZ4225819.1 NAD-dependent epimerase/dehydratase family protein [Candidatus Andersenbacteria bacterium]
MPISPIVKEDIAIIAQGIAAEADKLSGKTVLISGGAGFLGKYFLGVFSYLNENVLGKPCKVISVDNYITGDRDENFDFSDKHILNVWGDVTVPLPVREDIDYIIHAAGLASPVYYMKYPLETIESAVTGAKNLLELARKNKLEGFLFFSSSEIYGDPDPRSVPTPETYHGNVSSVGPRACYDESKRLTETICTIYHQRHNVPVKIVRPFNVFGPGMKHNDRRVIPMFAYQALNGEKLSVHGDGHQTRTFCYISDAMTGFLKVLLAGRAGEAYNVGNEKNEISMRDLAQVFVELSGDKSSFNLIPYPENYPAGEPQRRCPDLTKARSELKYTPQVDFRAGIERAMNWCRTQESYMGKQVVKELVNVV